MQRINRPNTMSYVKMTPDATLTPTEPSRRLLEYRASRVCVCEDGA